jgi:tetratricopeptide (TPR) repeat protein
MPAASKKSHGPKVQARAKHLLQVILGVVADEDRTGGIKFNSDWADTTLPRLTLETTLQDLTRLTHTDLKANTPEFKRAKVQVGEALGDFRDFVQILDDYRTQKKGSSKWHFSLRLWGKDADRNLAEFDKLWESKRPTHSQTKDVPDSKAPIADKYSVPSITERPLIKNHQEASNSHATQINDARVPVVVGSDPTLHINLPKQQDEPSEKIVLMLPASSSIINSSRWVAEFKRLKSSIENASAKHGRKPDRKFEKYKFESYHYITSSELSQELTTLEPSILHLTGDTEGIGELVIGTTSRNTGNQDELIFNFFKLHSRSLRCVVLSGCCVEEQVNGIIQHIDFLVSIPRELEEVLSMTFLDEFYFQIGFVGDIRKSYDLGLQSLNVTLVQRPDFERRLLPKIFSKEKEVQRRDLEKKLEICISDLEAYPNDLALLNKQANLLKDLGKVDETNKVYEKIAALDPDYRNRLKQGDALQSGEYKKAESAYDKAAEAKDEEKDYTVWWEKAIAYAKAGEYIKAGDAYQKALWLLPPSPDDYVICTQYGVVLSKLKHLRESVQLYSTSLCVQPNYRVASYHRKQLYKKIYLENR